VAGATTAGWRALGDRPTVGVSVEHGEQARGVFALAVMAGDGRVGVLHRTQGVKASTAIQADVFVEGHMQRSERMKDEVFLSKPILAQNGDDGLLRLREAKAFHLSDWEPDTIARQYSGKYCLPTQKSARRRAYKEFSAKRKK